MCGVQAGQDSLRAAGVACTSCTGVHVHISRVARQKSPALQQLSRQTDAVVVTYAQPQPRLFIVLHTWLSGTSAGLARQVAELHP